MVRRSRPGDAKALRAVHAVVYPDEAYTAVYLQQLAARRLVWVAEDGGSMVGYTAVSLIPGLNAVYSLTGGVLPVYRRQGVGSQLMANILRDAPSLGVRQLSCPVTNLDSAAARFLCYHGFYNEHEEWFMSLSGLEVLPTAVPPPTCRIKTYNTTIRAAQLFRALYDRSFGPFPWYQPYSMAEIEAALIAPTELLFLFKAEKAIGFAWLHTDKSEIEPIGIVKREQGQGYGRFLLLAALHHLKQQGSDQAQIGVWRSNHAAIQLYQSLGFQHNHTIIYLALDLKTP